METRLGFLQLPEDESELVSESLLLLELEVESSLLYLLFFFWVRLLFCRGLVFFLL